MIGFAHADASRQAAAMQRNTIEPAGIVVPYNSIGATAVRGMAGMLGSRRMVSAAALASRTSSSCTPGEFIAVLQGHQNAAGDLTPGRIVSGHKQIGDHSDGLAVGEALAVGLGGQ